MDNSGERFELEGKDDPKIIPNRKEAEGLGIVEDIIADVIGSWMSGEAAGIRISRLA